MVDKLLVCVSRRSLDVSTGLNLYTHVLRSTKDRDNLSDYNAIPAAFLGHVDAGTYLSLYCMASAGAIPIDSPKRLLVFFTIAPPKSKISPY